MGDYHMKKREKIAYQQAYYDNEADANKYMSYVNGAAGILAIVIWVLYLTKVFTIPDHFYVFICILFPVIALIMLIPLLLVKTDLIKKPGYKYFILFSLLTAIIALNISIPKHSLLFWPFAILIANHYYSPTIGRVIYIVSIIAMLACLYLGMFFGEYDENLFGGGVIKADGTIGTVETLEERIALLNQKAQDGDNRYLKVLLFYYFPRAAIVTLFFMVSNLLNRRAYNLLDKEIKIHDEQEKNKTELNVAKQIQIDTLPSETVSSKDIEILGELKAAKEVGGDLYDYLDIDENHVAFLIGDVSGKGVPAAMFMMKTITSFRDFAAANKSPSQILKEINSSIYKGNKASMFVTCFLAILDKRNGKLVYSNAGHNPPIVGNNKNYEFLKCNQGFLLGCFPDAFITDEEITLKTGDCITLYTDGVTEARNSNGDFFGEERLLKTMNNFAYTCVAELHHSLKEAISEFVGDASQSDDITFLTVSYRGGSYSYKEKQFDAKKENIIEMLTFIEDFVEEHNFPVEFKQKLVIVGDELLSNIVKYGYENKGGDIFVRLLYNEDKNEFAITIVDKGVAFNQLEVDEQEVGSDIKKQQIGGLGLLIVKKIMDEYGYDRVNEKNILVLKKRFNR